MGFTSADQRVEYTSMRLRAFSLHLFAFTNLPMLSFPLFIKKKNFLCKLYFLLSPLLVPNAPLTHPLAALMPEREWVVGNFCTIQVFSTHTHTHTRAVCSLSSAPYTIEGALLLLSFDAFKHRNFTPMPISHYAHRGDN